MTTEQQPSDAELISAVRGGETTAYGELFARHVEAARRLARQLTSAGDVEDLVSEAFAKVLTIVQRGGGPDLAFRIHLLTAVRGPQVGSQGVESQAASCAFAFATLPERWQLVLWHTEVEGQKPADVAQLLGMSANSVSALAYRAREGLRQAFLNMHAQDTEDDACAWTQDNLGAYIRNAASKRDSAKVRAHIDECRRCMGIYLELSEVNTNLSGILGPLVLGNAAAGYLTAGSNLPSPVRLLRSRAGGAALAGVAAVTVLISGLVLGLQGTQEDRTPPQADAPVIAAPVPNTFGPDAPTIGPRDARATPDVRGPGATAEPAAPATSSSPATGPSTEPSRPGNPGATPEPDDDPDENFTPQPDPPSAEPPNDVVIRATDKELDKGGVWNVKLAVHGLDDGSGVVLVKQSNDSDQIVVIPDNECHPIGPGDYECPLGPNPDLLNFTIVAEEGAPRTNFIFEVKPGRGVVDFDPYNNRRSTLVTPTQA
jgi:DNA-directed RNA polymerase specialized sigma24 family protein